MMLPGPSGRGGRALGRRFRVHRTWRLSQVTGPGRCTGCSAAPGPAVHGDSPAASTVPALAKLASGPRPAAEPQTERNS
eukprot:753626-Hanusia_phi.AAC.6